MRRTRILFLLAIVLILGAVGSSYYIQKKAQFRQRPTLPEKLPLNVNIAQKDWVYFKGDGNRPIVEVRAREMQRVEEGTPRIELKKVVLKLYHKDGKEYDLVKCETAVFAENDSILFSDGDVEITLAVPAADEESLPKGRLLRIDTSGVRVDTKTGLASTERPATFQFDRGDGKAVGASYDPHARELRLTSEVELNWRGDNPDALPMKVQAGTLRYMEAESQVYLSPWSKFFRGTLSMEGADAVITLEEGVIRRVDAQKVSGADRGAQRTLHFAAAEMQLAFTAGTQMEKITGAGAARLEADSSTALTRVDADRLSMEFAPARNESILKSALAAGHSTLESRPVVKEGTTPPAAKLLRSEAILLVMKDGGREIERIETHSEGTLDLLPNAAGQAQRRLTAHRMWMHYGENNQLQSFRAVQAATESRRPAGKPKEPAPPPSRTWSEDLTAEFDPQSGEMARLEQWGNFRYQAGDQHALAARAILDSPRNLITLSAAARAWDRTGSVSADTIALRQDTGDFTAEGNVTSTRLPDPKSNSSSLISAEENMQARARRMMSGNRNRLIEYEGDAVLWQSSNRLQASRIVIDREAQTVEAQGNVFSQFLDKRAPPDRNKAGSGKGAAYVVVRSEKLRYTDKDRLAHYTGSVRLIRESMDVQSSELRAWLRESGGGKTGEGGAAAPQETSSLEKAFADGNVRIFSEDPGRTRRASAEHAEYMIDEEKVVLLGGTPQLIDSAKGTTRGRQLTWFARNDSLQVDGAPMQPGVSRIRRN